ncbi:hypothetical protein [Winogradskyella eckloniae]|uniref:hypothetical protein n=1 Tax=Winogradskyella eckloniae TaxID=1089306 RepID=UPI0018850ACB|nr:hypothetical protein [Winogradskyella eckloniae]
MDKLQPKSKKRKENSLNGDNNLSRTAILGTIIATFISSTPLLYLLHESVPDTAVWDTFLGTYESGFWESAQYAMWVYTGKIVPLILMFIWFFTCKHWWYHALLVPIVMYSFQIITSYHAELKNTDENQILILLPVLVIVVPSIYLIRAKMFNKINMSNKTLEEMEAEFMIRPKGVWGKVKQYF